MKKNTHKYFVNQRHKNKLEANSGGFRTYWSHVIYYTKEPDTRDIRESTSSILYRAERWNKPVEEIVQEHIERYGRHTKDICIITNLKYLTPFIKFTLIQSIVSAEKIFADRLIDELDIVLSSMERFIRIDSIRKSMMWHGNLIKQK